MEAVGIDDISIYFPKLHFEIEAFAAYRNMDFSKLNKGLGLESMSIPVTLAKYLAYSYVIIPVDDPTSNRDSLEVFFK